MLQGDSKQVCQYTTTKFRDEPNEERRWVNAEMVVVAVANAFCCNEMDVDVPHKCRDEQVKIVATKQVSEVPIETFSWTVLNETVPALEKRKLLNAQSNASRRSSKIVAASSSYRRFTEMSLFACFV